eukprot:600686-Rhodomonas_salina.2
MPSEVFTCAGQTCAFSIRMRLSGTERVSPAQLTAQTWSTLAYGTTGARSTPVPYAMSVPDIA